MVAQLAPGQAGLVALLGVLAATTIVSHALARATYPILLPAIEDELLTSHQQAGLLSTTNFVAYLLGVAAVTAISGRVEPGRLLLCGVASAGTGFVVLASADGFARLAGGQVLAGLGCAGIWMSAPVLATGAVGPQRRGTVMGLLSSVMGLGIVLAGQGTNLVRAVADDPTLWRPTWWAAAGFSAVVLLAALLVPRPRSTAAIGGGISLRRLRTVPSWLALAAGYWLSGLMVSSFTPFFGAALEEAGFSRSHVANLYSLFGLSAAFGAISLGRLSDRVGRRPVLLGAVLATSAAAALTLAAREPAATVAALLFGAASFTFPVLVAAYLSDHLQGRELSNALGALTLIYGTALAAGPWISGTIGDSRFGFELVFATVTVYGLVAAGFISRLGAATPHRDPLPPGAATSDGPAG